MSQPPPIPPAGEHSSRVPPIPKSSPKPVDVPKSISLDLPSQPPTTESTMDGIPPLAPVGSTPIGATKPSTPPLDFKAKLAQVPTPDPGKLGSKELPALLKTIQDPNKAVLSTDKSPSSSGEKPVASVSDTKTSSPTAVPLPASPKPADAERPHLEVKNLVRSFDGRVVLDGISFKVKRGETLVILGGSGCGKSTLLRHIIGSLKPDSGEIWLMGQEITRMSERDLEAIRKKFGMLFQGSALLNSITVGENVALPLQEHTDLAPDIMEIMVKMKTSMVGLTGFENLMPSQISGGMKKRVALARAIAMDPEMLFCDEPTAGLDPVMTAVVDVLINDLCKKMGMTAIVVTHDMASVYRIADHIVMLHKGKVVFEGTSEQIKATKDPLVRQFIEGNADGPISFKQSGDNYLKSLLGDVA